MSVPAPGAPKLPAVPQWVAVIVSTLIASIPANSLAQTLKTGHPFADALLQVLGIGTFAGALHSLGEYVRSLGWTWWPT